MKTKLFMFLTIGGFLLGNLGLRGQDIGDPAPDFSLKDLSDNDFTLSEQKGNVVFLFFFGYNCPHCLSNAPNTQTNVYEVHKNKPGFVAVGIDTYGGNSSSVLSFKTSTGIEYDLLLRGASVASAYKTSHDRIYVIDADGVIQYISPGYATDLSTMAASDVITNLLSTTTGIFGFNHSSEQLSLLPNPATDQISFINPYKNEGLVNILLTDISGRNFLSDEIFANPNELIKVPFGTLPKGIYLLSLSNEIEKYVSKLIIE